MRRPIGWWGWRGAQVLGLVAALATVGVVLAPAHGATSVTYRLAWATDGVTVAEDGSWTTVTDTGAEVTVTAGSLSTWSVTLVECPHGHGVLDRLTALLGVGPAAAGHESQRTDPAEAVGPVVQSLIDTRPVLLGEASLVEPDHCEAHSAVAGAASGGDGDGDEPTLSVTGTWRAAGSDRAEAFTIESGQAWGAIVDAEIDGDIDEVLVVRTLATMFDGVDPAGQSEIEQARTVLANLTEQTDVVPA